MLFRDKPRSSGTRSGKFGGSALILSGLAILFWNLQQNLHQRNLHPSKLISTDREKSALDIPTEQIDIEEPAIPANESISMDMAIEKPALDIPTKQINIIPANSPHLWIGVNTLGRLGNQLFIIMSCRGIAKVRSRGCCILNAINGKFPSDGHGDPEDHVLFDPPLIACPHDAGPFVDVIEKVNEDLLPELMNPDYLNDTNIRAGIYIQSFKYFRGSYPILPFRLKAQAWADQWLADNGVSIGIHARLGDKGLRFDPNYFSKAIVALGIAVNRSQFIVCSDSPEWVENHTDLKGMHISKGRNAGEDMALLAGCKHLIMTIGTYGWWAGYLLQERYPLGRVIYHGDVGGDDHWPKSWIKAGP